MAKIDWQVILKGLYNRRYLKTAWMNYNNCSSQFGKRIHQGQVVHPCITREIRDSIKTKDEAYKLARKSNLPEDWEEFRVQKRGTKGLIRKGKIDYERKLAGNIKTDCKGFYRYVKKKRLVKTNVGPLQSETGELIMRNKDMAD